MLAISARLAALVGLNLDRSWCGGCCGLNDTLQTSLGRLPTLGADQVEMVFRLASSGAGVECEPVAA